VKHFLYVIGEPGSGKSTLTAALTADTVAVPLTEPFAMLAYNTQPVVVELGRRRQSFPGTDALALNVQPKVLRWLEDTTITHVLAEGDRLANGRFFQWLIEHGWNLRVARLRVSPSTARARREERESRQDDSWVESRRTKVDNLGALFPERTTNLWHEEGDTEAALAELRARSPVAAAFA
jgi:P-loop Nucleotide Kinase3